MSKPRKPRRHWYQYSLRSLLVLTLLVSLGMSYVAVRLQKARRQKEAVEKVKELGGMVDYDYEFDANGVYVRFAERPGPGWLRRLLGDDLFITVTAVFLASTQTGDADLERLQPLTQITYLALPYTKVSDFGLEHLKGMRQLRVLLLDSTKISDAGLENLKGLTRLELLDLRRSEVTDAGLEHVMGLTRLEYLSLIDTKVTDEGVKRLQAAVQK